MTRPRLTRGLVQVYTGDGKGKSTAAFGLALRAIGHGFKVYIVQFMKGNSYYGELQTFQRLFPDLRYRQFGRVCTNPEARAEGECLNCGKCFLKKSQVTPEDRDTALKALEHAREIINSDEYDLVILDELNNALRYGLLSVEEVLPVLRGKPDLVEVVLTGRGAPPEIIAVADLVTEMKPVKHPMEKGIRARRGIEF